MKMDWKDFGETVSGDNVKEGEGQVIDNTVSLENRHHPQQSGGMDPSIECGTQEHKSATAKFLCQVCNESLSSFYNLHLHLKEAHKATIKLTCNLCSKTFHKNRELINHLETHQNDPEKPHSTSNSKPKTNRKKAVSSSKPKPKAKRAKRARKNTNKTEKSTSFTKGKRKGDATLKEQAKKSKIDETTEISLPPSVDSDKTTDVRSDFFVDNLISPPSPSPPPALSPQNLTGKDDWGWDTDLQLSQPESSIALELRQPPVSSSLPVPVSVSSPKSPHDADLQESFVLEDYFEPLSPKLEVFDDWDGEDHVFNSVGISSTPCNVSENRSSTPFHCSKCDLQFQTQDLLQIHQSFHNLLIQVKFRCEVSSCFQYFDDAAEYQRHFTSSHTNNRSRNRSSENRAKKPSRREDAEPNRLLCSLCPSEFETTAALEKHRGVAHGIKPFPCPQCDREYVTKRARRDHVKSVHLAVKPFTCPQCPGRFFCSKYALRTHLPSHSSEQPFVCPTCATAYKRETELKDHMKRHTGIKSYVCPVVNCSMAFTSSSELRYHRRKIHRSQEKKLSMKPTDQSVVHKCGPCNKLYPSAKSYSRHIKTVHSGDRPRPAPEVTLAADPEMTGTETEPPALQLVRTPHACDLCEASFLTRLGWARHKLGHPDNADVLCYFCGRQFLTAEVLEGHKQLRHANTKDPRKKGERIICHVCGKSFCSAHDLRSHMDRHNGVTLICDECGKPCKSAPELKLHKNTHLAEKPFKCKFCPYRYNTPSVVYQHMQYHHTGPGDSGFVESPLSADLERNFPCNADGCSQSFTSLPGLKQHQLYHAGEKKASCKKCDEKFVTIFDAYVHKTTEHKKQENQTQYECTYCQKSCVSRTTLGSHIRYNHTLEEPFACTAPDCDRKFKTKPDLRYHTVVAHTGEYKFECEVCGKKVATRGNYNTHMRVHTGIRVFRCEEEEGCEASFKAASLLKKHLYKEHGRTDLGAEVRGSRWGRTLMNPRNYVN